MRILPVIVNFLICLINTVDKILQLIGIVLYPLTKENVLKGKLRFRFVYLYHRCDSIQGTDYIANPFFLNLKVSRTTIKNLRLQSGRDIIQVTFGKFVTSLVQKLKKKCEQTDW